jgi:hypothetical protein
MRSIVFRYFVLQYAVNQSNMSTHVGLINKICNNRISENIRLQFVGQNIVI